MNQLPIDESIPEILTQLFKERCLVLQATPGSGKTTRVPPALLPKLEGQIWVLEPRRLAAKFAAHRVADEQGFTLGSQVGYQFRFENRTGPKTRLVYLTEGVFLRRLLSNPKLKGVSAIVLDEFHERSLQTDIAIAYLKKLRIERPDLALLVMSATLDTEQLTHYLEKAPVVSIEAPSYPVETQYLDRPWEGQLAELVANKVAQLREHAGDILVFLPGMGEIRRTEESLGKKRLKRRIYPLHGSLSFEEQSLAVSPSKESKIILSTNVAETSLTIEGVGAVIDSGLHRQSNYSWWSGLPSLQTRPTSQASAIQRAGRAGRTKAGYCLRLFTQSDFEARPAFETPEIQRSDLCETFLLLARLGARVEEFPWFQPPREEALESTKFLLQRLGALRPDGSLTSTGQRMSDWPLHPRFGRLLLEAERLACFDAAAEVAARLSENDTRSLDLSKDIARPLSSRARRAFQRISKGTEPSETPSQLGAALFAAFPDRIAKKKEGLLVFSSGGSARLPKQVHLEGDYFVALQIREMGEAGKGTQVQAESIFPIKEDLLWESPFIDEKHDYFWDKEKRAVLSKNQVVYDRLILEETFTPAQSAPKAQGLLLKYALGLHEGSSLEDWSIALERLLGKKDTALLRLAQLDLLEKQGIENELHLTRQLWKLTAEATSEKQLKSLEWEYYLQSLATTLKPYEWESVVPTQYTFPNGRRTRIHYAVGKSPWIASKLQDFFGLEKGPSLCHGKIPILLHLLAPNQRPAQITQDLESFWNRTYAEVRKELRRRYPKHPWPEDPRKP